MKKFEVSSIEVENALIDAIYWWDRTEGYYHRYFKGINLIHEDPAAFTFFVQKIFSIFLREYSIRRNIPSGEKSVTTFLDLLLESEFIESVKDGDPNIIDKTSDKLIKKRFTDRRTISLLSKIAFLINPSVYSLYDSLAKNSLYKVINLEGRVTRDELQTYHNFHKQILELSDKFEKLDIFSKAQNLLREYSETEAVIFFSKNEEAFKLRLIDKFLWIYSSDKEVNNLGYKNLLRLEI